MKYVLLLLLVPVVLIGQEYQFKGYTYSKRPYEVPEEFAKEDEIFLEKNRKTEIINMKDGAIYVSLYHERILLLGDDAVERNNRIYLPFRVDESLLDLKVKVTNKSGKEIIFDKADILEETDTEKGIQYKYFAVKGLEKGSVIEKIFVLAEQARLNDNEVEVQEGKPILDYSFELIHPQHLEFKTKSYNGLEEAKLVEKAYKDRNAIKLSAKNLPGYVSKFRYDNKIKNIQRFRFKLENNSSSGQSKLFNYKEFAAQFYDNLYKEISSKDIKEIDAFIKINKSASLFDNVRAIEHKVKTQINFDKYYAGNDREIAKTIKTKKASETDLILLFLAIFRKNEIRHELVFTTNRYQKYFDEDFETTGNLSEILFYFPDIDMYMCPEVKDERMPIIPYGLGNNKGLFIKEKEFGGVKMGIGKVGDIKLPNTTMDTMIIKIDMTSDMANPTVSSNIQFGGYAAAGMQPLKDFVAPDDFKEILESIAKNYSMENAEYEEIVSKNDGLLQLGKTPYIINLKFKSPDLVQKAGDSYLVKIGETIGGQIEMYDSTERKVPVEIQYPHFYYRKIELAIPDGYKVSNPEIIKMNYETIIDGKKEAIWVSDYQIEKNKLIITNTEYYAVVDYPLSVYKPYREVVNAAADFNKIVLVLKKE